MTLSTLRTKSKGRQWRVWLCAALVFLVVYVVLSLCFYDAVGWDPFDNRCNRLMLPLVALFILVARVTRWDGGRRKGRRGRSAGRDAATAPLAQAKGSNDAAAKSGRKEQQSLPPQPSTPSSPGEELFNRARALPHQPIPDFTFDGEYLGLLGKSAAAGYAPALAKLGEYAMRRVAWVEAYYWMTQARRNGMHGLLPTLREIRQNWAGRGFPDEMENVSELFPVEAGSLGRALLHRDSGHDAAAARKFLKAHHPEFL